MRGILLSLILLSSATSYADSVQRYHEKEQQLQELLAANQETLEKQQMCLARAIYFEASHYEESQIAVGNVIINRMISQEYPHTICGVIHQKTISNRTGKKVCQFSYLCEEKKKVATRSSKWENAQQTAVDLIDSFINQTREDPTDGATHFHDYRVHPTWAKSKQFIRTVKTKKLSFYKKKGK